MNNIFNKYLRCWQTLSGWKLIGFYLLHYTLLFFILQKIIFSDFAESNKSFIWAADGLGQYIPRYIYISEMFKECIYSFFSGNGLQLPIYNFFSWAAETDLQVEPFQWFAAIWPGDKIDTLYDILVIVRYYFIGFSFSILGLYFKQKPIAILIGSVSYMFCGFGLYAGVIHPHFSTPMILLPLLIIGAENILRNQRSILFTIIVFISLINSLYWSCMLAILIFIYILVRFFCVYKYTGTSKLISMVCRFIIWGGIGITLSGVVLVPTLFQILGNGRMGREAGNLVHYSSNVYEKFISNYIVIPDSAAFWNILGFSVLAIPAIILLFIGKNSGKARNSLRCLFVVLTIMYCSPFVAYVMSGFNEIMARWSFAYALCVASVIMFELPRIQMENKNIIAAMTGCSFVYIIICYFVIDRTNYHEESLVLLIVSLSLLICCYIASKQGKQMILPICLFITCVSVCYTSTLMYDSTKKDLLSEFVNKGEAYLAYESGQYASLARSNIVENDNSFFRVSADSVGRLEPAISFHWGLKGLSFYTSSIVDSFKLMESNFEIQQKWTNNIKLGIDGRAPILSLFNVKYLAKRDSSPLPYGFVKIDSIGQDTIFENKYVLPIGYTYDGYFDKKSFDALSSIEKQEVILQAVVLDDTLDNISVPKRKIDIKSEKLAVNIVDMTGLSWQDGILKVDEEMATMTLAFNGIPGADTYLRVVNLDLTDGQSTRRWNLLVETADSSIDAFFAADGYLYSHGIKTQNLYLGNSDDGYTNCTLTFPSKGSFVLNDLEVWCQPMGDYAIQIEELRAETLENIKTNGRGLSGTIDLSTDKIMCFGIPYEDTWSIYVDGEKRELMQANIGLMAVDLKAGYHYIELKYWIPGLTIGICLSCFGFIAFVFMIIAYKRKRIL